MTMAAWLTRPGMGLPSTTHIESAAPAGWPSFDNPKAPLPDLWGYHPTDPKPWWLIEAKAGLKIGRGRLTEGQDQLLSASALMADLPHRLLLAGTSVEEVFMPLADVPPPPPAGPGASDISGGPAPGTGPDGPADEDDQALLAAALDQMLVYLHLRYGPVPDLRVIPVAAARPRRARAGPSRWRTTPRASTYGRSCAASSRPTTANCGSGTRRRTSSPVRPRAPEHTWACRAGSSPPAGACTWSSAGLLPRRRGGSPARC